MSVEQVTTAVESLSRPVDPQVRAASLKWLERFQNTIEAWEVAIQILARIPSCTMDARLFAAQTLKHKLVSDYGQLEEEMARRLQGLLWRLTVEGEGEGEGENTRERASNMQGTPNPLEEHKREGSRVINLGAVERQLVLGLAALTVQSEAQIWPTPVEDLISMASDGSLGALSVLGAIPEQLGNPMIHMASTRRDLQRRRLLEINADRVVALTGAQLEMATGGTSSALPFSSSSSFSLALSRSAAGREALVGCLLGWIRYAPVRAQVVGSPALLQTVLSVLLADAREGDVGKVEGTAELTCEMFYRLFQTMDAPSSDYLAVLLAGLGELHGCLEGDGGEGLRASLGQVFVEAGEAFLPWLLPNPPAMQIILDAILRLCEQGDEPRAAEGTFSFWEALVGRLLEISEESRDPYKAVFARLFRSLIVHHLIFPPEHVSMTAEEQDRFRDMRHVIGDCLKDCTRFLGSTEALLIIMELLSESATVAASSNATHPPWQLIEGPLFAMRTIASVVDRRESEALPQLIPQLLQLASSPSNHHSHPRLVYAVLLIIGCYADWLRYNRSLLPSSLELVAFAISQPLSFWTSSYSNSCSSYAPSASASASATVSLSASASASASALLTATPPPLSSLTSFNPSSILIAASATFKYLAESCGSLLLSHEPILRSLYLSSVERLPPRQMLDLSEAMANMLAAHNLPASDDGRNGRSSSSSTFSTSSNIATGSAPLTILLPAYLAPWIERLERIAIATSSGGILDERMASIGTAALDNLAIFLDLLPELEHAQGHPNEQAIDDAIRMLIPRIVAYPANEMSADALAACLKAIVVQHGRLVRAELAPTLLALIDQLFLARSLPASLLVLRHLIMADPPVLPWSRLRESLDRYLQKLEGEISPGTISLVEMLLLMTAVLDYCDELLAQDALLLVRTLGQTLPILQEDPPCPEEISMALRLLAHLLQRLAIPEKIPPADSLVLLATTIDSNVQAMLAGLVQRYPLSIIADAASVLRRYHHHDSSRSLNLFSSLLAALPEVIFPSREKQSWLHKYHAAIEATRPRELKEMLTLLVQSCRRRIE